MGQSERDERAHRRCDAGLSAHTRPTRHRYASVPLNQGSGFYGLAFPIGCPNRCCVSGNSVSSIQKGDFGLPRRAVVLVAIGSGWVYYAQVERGKREELSRRLIRPDEIVFAEMALGQFG